MVQISTAFIFGLVVAPSLAVPISKHRASVGPGKAAASKPGGLKAFLLAHRPLRPQPTYRQKHKPLIDTSIFIREDADNLAERNLYMDSTLELRERVLEELISRELSKDASSLKRGFDDEDELDLRELNIDWEELAARDPSIFSWINKARKTIRNAIVPAPLRKIGEAVGNYIRKKYIPAPLHGFAKAFGKTPGLIIRDEDGAVVFERDYSAFDIDQLD